MADIIDSFVVTLGLDPREYKKEIKEFRDDRKRLAEEDTKFNRQSEDGQKRMVQGLRSLRNETAGFLFMLAGANGIKDFAANILAGDAATGRLATNLGLATEELSAWEGAVKRVGGSAGDIDNVLRSLSSAFQSLQLTGTTGKDADFQGLGVNSKDLQNPEQALLKISEASGRMNRQEFNARLSRLGFDENTINLLAKGRAEVTRMLDEQRKLGVATDASALAAQRFQEKLAMLETGLTNKLRPGLESVVTVIADWLDKGDNLNTLLTVGGGLIVAIGVAAAAAFWPFTALAGAIALVATNLDTLKKSYDQLDTFWKGVGESTDPIFDPVRRLFGFKTGAEARADGTDVTGSKSPRQEILDRYRREHPQAAGPAAPPPPPTRETRSAEDQARAFFQGKGFSPMQARGMVAAMRSENDTLGADVRNPTSGAYGIGQWLGARQRALFAKYGPRPTLQQQLEFMYSEMRGGDRGAVAGTIDIMRARTSGEAARAMVDKFYRPGAGAAGDYGRAGRILGETVGGVRPGMMASRSAPAAGASSTTTQTTTVGQVIIYSAATDAEGLAHDMRGALAKRGLVTQANTGLQP